MIETRLILADDAYKIRHEVLRPNDPLSFSLYEYDNDADAFHLGAYWEGELVGVASFFNQSSPRLHFPNQMRVRGLAVLHPFRSKGAGTALLENAYPIIKGIGNDVIWTNVWTNSKGHFFKLGFIELPEVIYDDDNAPMKVMYRKI